MSEVAGGSAPASEPDGHEAEALIERAIESVLHQAPDVEEQLGDDPGRAQPWADVSAPPASNKRPLDDLLHEYASRVAMDPDATAALPAGPPPGLAFFERFGTRRERSGDAGPRRRRRRSGRGRAATPEATAKPAPTAAGSTSAERGGSREKPRRGGGGGGRRRSRRRRGGGSGEGGGGQRPG